MSQLHVNQIAGFLHRTFDELIDLSDASPNRADREKVFLTRALAAFSVAQLGGITPTEASLTITDGSGDNGVDALHYDRTNKTLLVVQSKWFGDGHGSFDRADVMKLTTGFRDLVNLDLSRFNAKVAAKSGMIKEAFYDAQARYTLVPVYTGQESFATEPQRDLDDCLEEFNDSKYPDAEELLSTRVLSQKEVYSLVARGLQGAPIDLEIVVYDWGEVQKPYAIYGQIAASDIANWWTSHYPQIVAPNIRMFLGAETDVNLGLQHTLLTEPQHFWHFNNGITATCREIRRKMIGGSTRETGHFTVHDVSIVNGAQTAGSISAAHGKKPEAVSLARVPVRFIAVGEDEAGTLGQAITRATNTQNRINRQDFVALDPEQQRIRDELRVDGITYNYKSGDGAIRDGSTFNIEEATVALACAHSDLSYSTQAKREIGRLWEDTSKPPYRALFNPSTSSSKVWQNVQLIRMVDSALNEARGKMEGREIGFTIHGNRFIAHNVIQLLPSTIVGAQEPFPNDLASRISMLVSEVLSRTIVAADKLFPQAYLAQLFKNQNKLSDLLGGMVSMNVVPPESDTPKAALH